MTNNISEKEKREIRVIGEQNFRSNLTTVQLSKKQQRKCALRNTNKDCESIFEGDSKRIKICKNSAKQKSKK